jgi:hypothetical protein
MGGKASARGGRWCFIIVIIIIIIIIPLGERAEAVRCQTSIARGRPGTTTSVATLLFGEKPILAHTCREVKIVEKRYVAAKIGDARCNGVGDGVCERREGGGIRSVGAAFTNFAPVPDSHCP